MLTSYSKHGRIKELHYSIVQDAREMSLKSISVGFEPEHLQYKFPVIDSRLFKRLKIASILF